MGKSNPYKRHFIYHIRDNTIHRRLDRIYITKRIKTKTCKISLDIHFWPQQFSITIQVTKKEPKAPGIWKLNTAILKHKNFQNIFQQFWKNWQKGKTKYQNQIDWWEIGKLYFKTLPREYCTKRNQQLNNKYQTLIKYINEEKFKLQPNIHKIEQYQQNLEDIENYETQGTIIRNKEKLILNEEKPAKYLFVLEKQKQNKKHITFLQNEKGKLLKTNSNIF